MRRRTLFTGLTAGALGILTAARASSSAPAEKSKVAYHLSEADKTVFVLGNIQNHLTGIGGPDKVDIHLIVQGPALSVFRQTAAPPLVAAAVAQLIEQKVAFEVCIFTLRAFNVGLADIAPGFVIAEKGAGVRLAELQGQGYAYLRP